MSKGFTFAKKSGRAFNGAHRDSGIIVHIIEGDELYNNYFGWEKALCGTKPGQRGNGWQYDRNFTPSCQKCIDKRLKILQVKLLQIMNNALTKTLTAGLLHGLKVLRPDGKTVLEVYGYTPKNNIIHFRENGEETFGCAVKTKPYLFPMSALTKEIEIGGERFVPIVELCRVFYGHGKNKYRISDNDVFVLCEHRNGESVYVHKDLRLVDFWIVEWLIEHHFNVFGLSSEEFIEVNETNNPYK